MKKTNNDGIEVWLKNGLFHRKNGPSIIYPDGGKEYHQNDKLHRANEPAIENCGSKKENHWYNNGKLHNKNGPAITDNEGREEYWIDGIEHSKDEFNNIIQKEKLNDKLNNDLEQKKKTSKQKI